MFTRLWHRPGKEHSSSLASTDSGLDMLQLRYNLSMYHKSLSAGSLIPQDSNAEGRRNRQQEVARSLEVVPLEGVSSGLRGPQFPQK